MQLTQKSRVGQSSGWALLTCVLAVPALGALMSFGGAMNDVVVGPTRAAGSSPSWTADTRVDPSASETVTLVAGRSVAAQGSASGEQAVDRYSGATRYGTAAEVAIQSYPNGTETVVLVGGEGLSPDSLIAAPYGAQHDAPVLLTADDHLPEETLTAIRQLDAKRVVLIGGPNVIGHGVVDVIESMGLSAQRIAGGNRYETAERVARELEPSNVAFIASGTTLVDALPGAAAASRINAPILYVENDEVRSETMEALRERGVSEVVVLGGPQAVSDAAYATLDKRFETRRLAGRDRYETSVAIAEYMLNEAGSENEGVFLARADNPIDAVAAGATGRPVLFTPPGHLGWQAARFIARHLLTVTLLGSVQALSERVEAESREAYDTTFVRNRDELIEALAEAEEGDIVRVRGDAIIDLTHDETLVIPAGVTLRSDRGLDGSNGALFKKDAGTSAPLFVLEDGASIRRIRLQGPDTSMQCRDCAPRYAGIDIRGDNAVVEHSEVWGWSMAVGVRGARDARVRHNHIHHNRRSGLGYGVVLYGSADAIIEHNHFHDNRHSVAGSGERDQSYEARYNLIDGGATGSVFDMHGEWENPRPGNENSNFAGNTIHIHHNTVIVPDSIPVAGIRGIPSEVALIENNCFSHPSVDGVAWQQRQPFGEYSFATRPPYVSNMTVRNNQFAHTGGRCH